MEARHESPAHKHAADHGHGHAHHEPGFLEKYIFSTDHKTIGIQYGITALFFLMFGFSLMMMMRLRPVRMPGSCWRMLLIRLLPPRRPLKPS